jgi:putative transcriptional regulator
VYRETIWQRSEAGGRSQNSTTIRSWLLVPEFPASSAVPLQVDAHALRVIPSRDSPLFVKQYLTCGFTACKVLLDSYSIRLMKNRLKELRQLRQWSQSDLARELGISRQAVNGFESGKFDPSLEMAFRIASLFNVAIQDAFTHEAKNSMPTLVKRFTDFLGFEFGFERFTEKAINAVKFAHDEALRSQKTQVEPAHLLAGLLADPTALSAQLLRAQGVPWDVIPHHEPAVTSRQHPKLNGQSKFVIELALQIVRLHGKKSIGTEHLLWGLVRLAETDKTILNELFQRDGIDLEALNQQLAETI